MSLNLVDLKSLLPIRGDVLVFQLDGRWRAELKKRGNFFGAVFRRIFGTDDFSFGTVSR
jgi:hypothetical protein